NFHIFSTNTKFNHKVVPMAFQRNALSFIYFLFNFNIKVYGSDYYLKVFWFDDSGGAQLYPNDFSADKKFKVEQLYPFPFNENAEYVIEKINKESKSEKINIMVIATKEKIPFIGEVNYSSLLKWIYSIKANQRCAFYQMAIIM
ncbi:MAG: DUF4384 domain-containing protein, partial [Bacteroidales bacterium]